MTPWREGWRALLPRHDAIIGALEGNRGGDDLFHVLSWIEIADQIGPLALGLSASVHGRLHTAR